MSKEVSGSNSIVRTSAGPIETATRWTIPITIVLLTFVTFLPALNNGFLNWDDEAVLLSNSEYRGLGWSQLSWMFTSFHHSLYRPLTWMTWGLDYLIWGMDPFGYHLTSLAFHCANTALFYFIALRLLRLSTPGLFTSELPARGAAGVAALLFSIHPLRVEPVAWVSGRENVVSGLFFLLTILFYLRAVEALESDSRYRSWMISAWAVFGMSLLSKAAGMTLPFALLIMDVYPLKRLQVNPRNWFRPEVVNVWLEKVPFLCLGVVAGAIAWLAKYQAGAMVTWQDYGLMSRFAQSLYGLAFYLWKTLIPLHLSPLYEMPQDFGTWYWSLLGSGVIVASVTTGLLVIRKSCPAGLGSWLYYIVIVAPVLGITQSGPQIAADRYTYLSSLGWPILAGGGVYYCWKLWISSRSKKSPLVLAPFLALVLIAWFGVLSWQQTQVWLNSERLWGHTLSLGPSIIAHFHLGLSLDRRGKLDESIQHYRKALELKSDYWDARRGLAEALARRGDVAEATQHYRRALQIHPGHSDLHVNFANVLAIQGLQNEAIQHYHAALRIDPANGNAYFNLGNMFALTGQAEKAMQSYRDALRVQPTHSDAHYSLANAFVSLGRLDEAIVHYQKAVKYKPDFAQAYHNLGRVLAAQRRLDQAIDAFWQALRIQPNYAEVHKSLSQALAEQGKREEALRHHREAVRILESRSVNSNPR